MLFTIDHTIHYAYSHPVFLEPHEIRLQPRTCADQRLEEFHFEVTPTPTGTSEYLDVEGNDVTSIWFDGLHAELTFHVRSLVETSRTNPFDYLLSPAKTVLPVQYDDPTARLIEPTLQRAEAADDRDEVARFAERLSHESNHQLPTFLNVVIQKLYEDFQFEHREEGDPWPPAQTLSRRRGACRDVAVLFVEICRCVGVAARFVSGYQEGDTEQEKRELHAWAEVYVPGGGWRGYDPTHGLAVADRHVAVAASACSTNAAPVTGGFRGTGIRAVMDTHVDIQVASSRATIQQAQQQQQQEM